MSGHISRAIWLFTGLSILASGFTAAWSEQRVKAASPQPLKILFIGNSHIFVNDVPGRVRQQLMVAERPTHIRAITKGDGRLIGFSRRYDVVAALNEKWDVIVLQEATASFLTNEGRSRFREAVRWFLSGIETPTRVVLYQTWPWRNGSRYFSKSGGTAFGLWRAMQVEYTSIAKNRRIEIAPVGNCWMKRPERNAFYSRDGNHASIAGSDLAAKIIARVIVNGEGGAC